MVRCSLNEVHAQIFNKSKRQNILFRKFIWDPRTPRLSRTGESGAADLLPRGHWFPHLGCRCRQCLPWWPRPTVKVRGQGRACPDGTLCMGKGHCRDDIEHTRCRGDNVYRGSSGWRWWPGSSGHRPQGRAAIRHGGRSLPRGCLARGGSERLNSVRLALAMVAPVGP
jgi:hypothetical protein